MTAVTRNEQTDPDKTREIGGGGVASIDRSAGHARYSHELPEETSAAMTRGIVRVVPLVFCAVLGSLAGSAVIGLIAAVVVFLAFDLAMEEHSVLLALFRRLRKV